MYILELLRSYFIELRLFGAHITCMSSKQQPHHSMKENVKQLLLIRR